MFTSAEKRKSDDPPATANCPPALRPTRETDTLDIEPAVNPTENPYAKPSDWRLVTRSVRFARHIKLSPSRELSFRFLMKIMPKKGRGAERFACIQKFLGDAMKAFNGAIQKYLGGDEKILPANTACVLYPWYQKDSNHKGITMVEVLSKEFNEVRDVFYYKAGGQTSDESKPTWLRIHLGWTGLPIVEMKNILPHLNEKLNGTAQFFREVLQAEGATPIGFLKGINPLRGIDKDILTDELCLMSGTVLRAHYGNITSDGEQGIYSAPNVPAHPGILIEAPTGQKDQGMALMFAMFPPTIVPGRVYPGGLRGVFIPSSGFTAPGAREKFVIQRGQHTQACQVTTQLTVPEVDLFTPLVASKPYLTLHRIVMDIRTAPGSPYVYLFTVVCPSDRNQIILQFYPPDVERATVVKHYMYSLVAAHVEMFAPNDQGEFLHNLKLCFSEEYIQNNNLANFDPVKYTFTSKIDTMLDDIHELTVVYANDGSRFQVFTEYDDLTVAERSMRSGNPIPRGSKEAQMDDCSTIENSVKTKSRKGYTAVISNLQDENETLREQLAAFLAQQAAQQLLHISETLEPDQGPTTMTATGDTEMEDVANTGMVIVTQQDQYNLNTQREDVDMPDSTTDLTFYHPTSEARTEGDSL